MSGDLKKEIAHWASDIGSLTHGIKSNWKNVVDNFLECDHCPTAHKDFCTLVDMDTYKVTTHGIYSSHMAEAGNGQDSAYDTAMMIGVSRPRSGNTSGFEKRGGVSAGTPPPYIQ